MIRKRYFWIVFFLAVVLTLLFVIYNADAAPYVPPHYTLTELPGPATALSDTGWVVGTANGEKAFRWKDGKIEWLPNLIWANGVNKSGDVAGVALLPDNQLAYAVSLTPSGLTFYRSRVESVAFGINDSGLVVGAHTDNFPRPGAWLGDHYVDLPSPSLPGYLAGEARAVNSQGWVVGWSGSYYDWLYRSLDRPVLWKPDKTVLLPMPAGASGAELYALSDTGVVGGFYWTDTPSFGANPKPYLQDLWTGKTVTYPQVTSGQVRGVNDAGVGVGDVEKTRAAIYGPDGSVWRLQALLDRPTTATLLWANDIDNLGRIVGLTDRGGFLLTPIAARYQP